MKYKKGDLRESKSLRVIFNLIGNAFIHMERLNPKINAICHQIICLKNNKYSFKLLFICGDGRSGQMLEASSLN